MIICTYNRAAVLPRAVDSVLAQESRDFELIIVDDGSTDETPGVVAGITDPRVRNLRQDNQGLGAARNAGAEASRGRYIVFLDDDDLAFPGWLAGFEGALANEACEVVCCGEVVVDDDGKFVATNLPAPMGPVFGNARALILPGTFVVRREVYAAAGGFLAGLEDVHHTEFALRLLPLCASRGWKVCTVEEPLVQRHVHPGGKRFTPEQLLRGTTYVLDHHRQQLEREPRVVSLYCGVAGVAAARTGDFRSARRFFRQAWRASPRQWRQAGRLALASVPPLGRLVWTRQARRRPSDSARGQVEDHA